MITKCFLEALVARPTGDTIQLRAAATTGPLRQSGGSCHDPMPDGLCRPVSHRGRVAAAATATVVAVAAVVVGGAWPWHTSHLQWLSGLVFVLVDQDGVARM